MASEPVQLCGVEGAPLHDAEVVSIIRSLEGAARCVDAEEFFLRFKVVCDLVSGHPAEHASYQASISHRSTHESLWLRWELQDETEGRHLHRSDDLDCPYTDGEREVDRCMLFDGHPGEHCIDRDGTVPFSWCRDWRQET